MCGFVALYDFAHKNNIEITELLNLIHHRGPDAQNVLNLENVKLGFARLSIIDIEGGKQPMQNSDGSISLVFNGEIYNYLELRNKLLEEGYKFSTKSDTEVILRMYEKYGIDMLQYLQGMYGVVIVDKNQNVSYVIRDRIGIKPIYYVKAPEAFAVASEIKPLLALPFVSKNIDKESVAEFLQYEYIHAPNTIFSDVKKLLPGHYLKVYDNNIKDVCYWDCNKVSIKKESIDICKQKLSDKFDEAIKLHLRSDVPIGAFLSGGIDSGLVVAFASKYIEKLNTYTLSFEKNDYDESNLAELVSKRYGTNHTHYVVSSNDMEKYLPEMLWYCDEPLGDSGILPNYIINQLVSKDGIKVVLSGAGGDELFGGYTYYFPNKKDKIINSFAIGFKCLSSVLKFFNPTNNYSKRIDMALSLRTGRINYMISAETVISDKEVDSFLKEKIKKRKIKEVYAKNYASSEDINKLLYTDLKTYLTDDLMLLADRTTMAHSIEGRVPFLHHPFVEYAFSIPEENKVPNNKRKWLLKEVAKDYLPEEFFEAPKRGFCAPIKNWSTTDFGRLIKKILLSSKFEERKLWNTTYIKKCVCNEKYFAKNFHKLYLLYLLEIYFRVHIDNKFNDISEIDIGELYE